MLAALSIFLALLLAIWITGRLAIKQLYWLNRHLIRSPKLITYGVALLLLPGTLLHELSHWLVAELLRVPTGKMGLLPKVEPDNQVRLGSLQIAAVDPFRRTLIGLAPLLAGLTVLFLIGSQLSPLGWPPILEINLKNLALFYAVFTVANTMFSSQKDLEVALLPAIVLILGGVLLWKLPLGLVLPSGWVTASQDLLNRLNQVLVVVLGLNFLWLALGFASHKVLRR